MVQLAIASLLIGAVFGLRFQVIVLLPISILGSATIGAAALLTGQPGLAVVYSIATYALALQDFFAEIACVAVTLACQSALNCLPARQRRLTARDYIVSRS